MTSSTAKYHMALAGEYFVAAQLQRLNIFSSITYGNAKAADVAVFDKESDRAVFIEVKTSPKGRWPIGPCVPCRSSRPYVFVYLPNNNIDPPRYFVMTQSDIHSLLMPGEQTYLKNYKSNNGREYGNKRGVAAMTMKFALEYENNWNAIITQLAARDY